MQHQRPTIRRTTPTQQAAADDAEEARIRAFAAWRADWNGCLLATLALASALLQRDFEAARAAYDHIEIVFAGPEGRA